MIIVFIVFLAVFLIVTLLAVASGTGASERVKQTMARLEALVASEGESPDEQIDIRKQELLSAIPWLNRVLLQLELAPQLRRLLYQADLKWTPGGLLLMSFAAWVISTYLIYLRSNFLIVACLLGLVPAAVPFAYVLHKRSRRFLKFEEGMPPALDLMVAGLRGGHSLNSVLDLVAKEAPAPVGPEFRTCFDEQNYGLELRTALDNLAKRIPLQDIRILRTAILIQKETGGNLAEVLEKCSHVIRERFRLKREISTKSAQGRLTGWILSFLPVVLGLALFTINPEQMSLLWKRPIGVKLLYTSAGMTLTGGLLIRKIIRIRV